MNSEIKSRLDNFIELFLNEPSVKTYLNLKKEIENSEEIKSLLDNLKKTQKNMALSLGTKDYSKNKEIYYSYKHEYENHPLIINFGIVQEEVNYLLKELERTLSSK